MARFAVTQPSPFLNRGELLRWLYAGRLTVVSGFLLGTLVVWSDVAQAATFQATLMFVVAVSVSVFSFWFTHLAQKEPTENFLYAQVLLDVLLVTGMVHITQGGNGIGGISFAPLYILVISAGALLLPLPGGVLIGGMASSLYLADTFLFHEGGMTMELGLQIGLFAVVAILTGILGDRLRSAGIRLGAVESELRRLQLDTSEILDSLSTGILTVDGGGRLAYLNPAGAAMLGLEPDAWVGAPILSAVDEIAPGMGNLLRRSVDDGAPVLRFKTSARSNGRSRILGVSTTVLDQPEEGLQSATAIFQDITDLERVDALDRRNQRLEAVAELSASLAHEIKNPLASIRSSVEQMSIGALEEQDRASLQRLVLSESDRLSRLLSEFLEFSGLRLGRLTRLDLAELTTNSVRLVRAHPDVPEGLTIECAGVDEPFTVRADEDLVHRAIYNLVLNAAQFSGENGRVRVELSRPDRIPAEAAHIASPVRLAVDDSGPGLDEAMTERMFDPFFTTRKGGSGLGLAVVHRAAEAHDGTVLAENRPEGGARFALYLPREGMDDQE